MRTPFTDIDRQYGWPEGLLDSVWQQESGRGSDTYNESSGCRGHFQFKPDTRDEVLRESGHDAFSNDPREAAQAAAYYLSKMQRGQDGNLRLALAAYNWGPGNLDRQGIRNAPRETRDYMSEILGRVGQPAEDESPQIRLASLGGPSQQETEEAERRRRLNAQQGDVSAGVAASGEMSVDSLLGALFVEIISKVLEEKFGIPPEQLAGLGQADSSPPDPSLGDNLTPVPPPPGPQVAAADTSRGASGRG